MFLFIFLNNNCCKIIKLRSRVTEFGKTYPAFYANTIAHRCKDNAEYPPDDGWKSFRAPNPAPTLPNT